MQCNTKQYKTIRYNTIPYDAIRYNVIRYDTIQYNTIWCVKVLFPLPSITVTDVLGTVHIHLKTKICTLFILRVHLPRFAHKRFLLLTSIDMLRHHLKRKYQFFINLSLFFNFFYLMFLPLQKSCLQAAFSISVLEDISYSIFQALISFHNCFGCVSHLTPLIPFRQRCMAVVAGQQTVMPIK